jgi:DNA repair protein RecO (recombination protein O)
MINVEALVIRSTTYGESNKIITLYSKEMGKVGVMARGAKKPKSKLGPGSQLFTHGHYLYQKGRGLGTLYQGEAIETFRYIKSDLKSMAYAAYMVDMVDKLTEEAQPYPSLFEWLLKLLELLEEKRPPEVLRLIFDIRMLGLAGIAPELDQCASCGGKEAPFFFSIAFGGFLCHQCSRKDERSVGLPNPVSRLFHLFKRLDPNKIGEISIKPETIKLMTNLLDAYFDHYSGLRLKTKQFLDQLGKMDI